MDEKITLRKASPQDARFIAENVLRALHIDETDDSHLKHLADISRREDTLYSWRNSTIALYDGVPAGLMVAYDGARYRQMRDITFPMIRIYVGDDYHSMDDEASAGEFYLDSLAVLPACRGLGIGRALLKDGIRKGIGLGFRQIALVADAQMPHLVRLYESIGFRRAERRHAFGVDFQRMVYALKEL